MTETVLLTGATGFLGMEVMLRLLERTDSNVLAVVRATGTADPNERLAEIFGQLYKDPPRELLARVQALRGDVELPRLGLDDHDVQRVEARVSSIVHCAATVAFDAPLADSLSTNTLGAAHVLELAERLCAAGSLRQLLHVSTAYVCGRHDGPFAEHDLNVASEFRNGYERSKAYAEHLLQGADAKLPLVVVRPSIVVGDSLTGWTPAFNVIYWPLRAFERGLLDSLPGDPGATLDIVPVDYVADSILALHQREQHRAIVHLVAGDGAMRNGDLAALAAEHAGRAASVNPQGAIPRLGALLQFLPYLNVRTSFEDLNSRQILGPLGLRCPEFASYFATVLGYARRARWGKAPLTRDCARSLTPADSTPPSTQRPQPRWVE